MRIFVSSCWISFSSSGISRSMEIMCSEDHRLHECGSSAKCQYSVRSCRRVHSQQELTESMMEPAAAWLRHSRLPLVQLVQRSSWPLHGNENEILHCNRPLERQYQMPKLPVRSIEECCCHELTWCFPRRQARQLPRIHQRNAQCTPNQSRAYERVDATSHQPRTCWF